MVIKTMGFFVVLPLKFHNFEQFLKPSNSSQHELFINGRTISGATSRS